MADRARLDAAVKSDDGFFTTYFVSSYSRYVVRWAARRGLTPNTVTWASMAVGGLAAAGFATGSRPGLVAGALLLQVAFLLDCVDGQLARYTGRFSALGAWLDGVFDRGKEYLAYAGLAYGTGGDAWVLAGAALTLQTVRHAVDFSYAAVTAGAPAPPPDRLAATLRAADRRRPLYWAKKIVVLPIGERFALISVTAAVWGARVTFLALLTWGCAGAAYAVTGKLLRSVRP